MDEPLSNLTEATPPHQRHEADKLVYDEYNIAHDLLKIGKYKEALRKFKWVFAQSSSHRFLLLPRDVKKLLNNYAPACTVIRRWRDEKERLILSGRADRELIHQWYQLNESLNERKRTRATFLKLEKSGANNEVLHSILDEIWPDLVKSKQYDLLETYLDTLAFHLLLHATEYDCENIFPERYSLIDRHQETLQYHVKYMQQKGMMSYEVALALGEKTISAAFARKILLVETSDKSYAGLIRAAIRARSYSEAVQLFLDAKNAFISKKLRLTFKAIRLLPKSQHKALGLR